MAIFNFSEIKCGFEGRDITYVHAISSIEFDEDDGVVTIPKEHNGNIITHVCYFRNKTLGYAKFHDWHHPAQGYDEYVPTEYYPSESSFLDIPKQVKKIIFPATVTNISKKFLAKNSHVIYEIDGESEIYTVNNGIIEYKKED